MHVLIWFYREVVGSAVVTAFAGEVIRLTLEYALVKRTGSVAGTSEHVGKQMRSLMPDGRHLRGKVTCRSFKSEDGRDLGDNTVSTVFTISDAYIGVYTG